MGDKLFDDLARALAEPMPRRRALRFIGAVLVATSFPRPAFARTRRSGAVTKCGEDERICREFTEQAYCCRAPSWQFFCGSRPGQCINMCAGGTKFPCTGLIPDRLSGVNGVCCDRKIHSRCRPDNPRDRMSGGGSKPECIPCTGTSCGPNKSFGINHPQRWTCCEKPNTCRKGVCKCPDGRPSCGGKECCKGQKVCKQCADVDSLGLTLTGTVKCCGKDESCCINTCCKSNEACCNGKCCPKKTQCARGTGGRDVCCPEGRVQSVRGDREYCCPAGTYPQDKGGCCPAGLESCCAGENCTRGSVCVNGKCVVP
jgi:hypothetical protein